MQKKQEKDEAADKINHDSEGGAEAQNPFHDGLPAHQNDAGDQARAEQQRRVVGAWRQKVRNGDHQQSQKGDGANKRRGDGHQNGDHSEGEQLHGADILPQIDRHIIAQRNYVQPMADGPHKDQANDDDRHADIKQVHIETVEAGVRRDLNMGIFIGSIMRVAKLVSERNRVPKITPVKIIRVRSRPCSKISVPNKKNDAINRINVFRQTCRRRQWTACLGRP